MRKNFIVDQAVYLIKDGNYYDLHNNYQFQQCTIMPNKAIIILIWVKLQANGAKTDDPNELTINFQNVSFFEMSRTFITERVKTIQEIGYKEPDDEDLNWLNRDENFKVTDHIFFRFEDDEYIRIHADYAEVKIDL